MFVYTIQPVVKPVVSWQPVCLQCWTVLNEQTRLSNWLYNPVWQLLNEQPLFIRSVVKSGCTTGLTTGCIHDTAICQTGLTTGWMFVYTIQPVWQLVVSCIPTFTQLSNRIDNRLYRVNGAWKSTFRISGADFLWLRYLNCHHTGVSRRWMQYLVNLFSSAPCESRGCKWVSV